MLENKSRERLCNSENVLYNPYCSSIVESLLIEIGGSTDLTSEQSFKLGDP